MRGIIQKIEAGQAHVLFDDGQVLRIAVQELGNGARTSNVVDIHVDAGQFASVDAADASRQKLNEILTSRPHE